MLTYFNRFFQGELQQQLQQAKLIIQSQQVHIQRLESKNNRYNKLVEEIPIAGFDSLNSEPRDQEVRKQFINEVVYAYDNYFEKKFRETIGEVRELLSAANTESGLPQNMTRAEYDWFVRGIEAGIWKIDTWCNLLRSERSQQLQDNE